MLVLGTSYTKDSDEKIVVNEEAKEFTHLRRKLLVKCQVYCEPSEITLHWKSVRQLTDKVKRLIT